MNGAGKNCASKREKTADNLKPTLVCAGLALAANQAARADVSFTVNPVIDLIGDHTNEGVCHTTANICSLRAAITQANHWNNPEFAIINLPAGVCALTLPVSGSGFDTEADGDLDLTAPLTADQRISWGAVAPHSRPVANGGATWTHALLPGSQAIDSTIDSLGCVDATGTPLSSDQRGGPRPVGPRCDVGAFEYGSVADTIFRNGFDGGM